MKISIIQPFFTAYRDPLFRGLSRMKNELTVYCGKSGEDFGFDEQNDLGIYHFLEWKGGFFKFTSLENVKRIADSDVIVHFGDFKYLTFWFFLFYSRFSGKKFFIHGQGGYKKNGFISSLVYNFSLFLSSGYICYATFSSESLKSKSFGFLHKKIHVAENMLYMKKRSEAPAGIDESLFYIGRIRDGCGIELLLDAAALSGVNVLIVGAVAIDFSEKIKNKYVNAIFYGSVFDEEIQFDIAKRCLAGAYGGDAGLSVVHYMAFGLPVIVHSDLKKHMGPEPSYIVDGINGLLFERENVQSLAEKIKLLKDDRDLRNRLATGASETFEKLQTPPMHEKFAKILGLI